MVLLKGDVLLPLWCGTTLHGGARTVTRVRIHLKAGSAKISFQLQWVV